MKKIIITFFACVITCICFGQANTYFHDRIDTTIFAVSDTVGHGANNYYATNTSPDFNVRQYQNGLSVVLFIKNGNTGASTLTLVTRTGTLSTKSIRKAPGSVLASGDLKDSCTALFTYYNGSWRLGDMIPASASSWMLTGNAGTTAGTNFIGTTDSIDFVVKTNNRERGRFLRNGGSLTLGSTGITQGKLNLKGLTSGSVTIASAAAAGSWNLTLPTDDGNSGQVLQTDGSGITSWATSFSPWVIATTPTTAITYTVGSVGIGTPSVTATLDIKSNNNTFSTSLLKGTNSSGTEIFNLRNNGVLSLQDAGDNVLIGGLGTGQSISGGLENVGIGSQVMTDGVTSYDNTAVGLRSQWHLTDGQFNTSIGTSSLSTNTTGNNNTAIGRRALGQNIGSGNVCLGAYTGYYQTASSNKLFIDNQDRGSSANELTNSLIYGVFDASVANQTLAFNTNFTGFGTNTKSGSYAKVEIKGNSSGSGVDYDLLLTNGAALNLQRTGGDNYIGFNNSNNLIFSSQDINSGSANSRVSISGSTGFMAIGGAIDNTKLTIYDGTSTGSKNILRLVNNSTSTNNNGAGIYLSNTTANGSLREFAQLMGIMTDNDNANYDGDFTISTTLNGSLTEKVRITSEGNAVFLGRLQQKQGTDVASSSTITITYTGNVFELTGTTTVDFITTTGWQEGSEITLIANENVTINDDAGGGNLLLAGNANFAMTANDVLTLIYSSTTAGGVIWREKSRSVN